MSELPRGWILATFDECNRFQSKTLDPTQFGDETFELYSVPSFSSGKPEHIKGRDIGSSKQLVQADDVLVCKINPRINRVWRVTSSTHLRQIASSEWIVMRSPELNANYLKHYFCSSAFRELICDGVTGVGGSLTRAQPKNVATFPILLAPLGEQKRIADKLDNLLTRIDACRERLDRLPALIKGFRQAVLDAATSGRLTEDWRNNAPLLKTELDNKVISCYGEFELAALPPSWRWMRFADVASIDSNLVPPQKYPDWPHIAPNHIESRTGRLLPYGTIASDQVTSAKHLFKSGQVLYSKIRPYLCKAALVDFTGLCSADMYPISGISVSSSYLHKWMLTESFTIFASSNQGRMVLPKINQAALNELPVPIPPRQEQVEIVRRVEILFAFADQFEARLHSARTAIDRVTPALLSKAFRGELVPQDPNDKPASILLDRIRSARAAAPAVARPATRRTMQTQTLKSVKSARELVEFLAESHTPRKPSAIVQDAEIEIDDFYAYLREAVKNGWIERPAIGPAEPELKVNLNAFRQTANPGI